MKAEVFFERVMEKLEKQETALSDIIRTVDKQQLLYERQQEILDEHTKRSTSNEETLKLVREEVSANRKDSITWSGIGKGLAAGGVFFGTLGAAFKAIEYWMRIQ